jgi:putative transposase
MIVRTAFKYRLYPTQQQEERLEWVLRHCQELYNAAVYQRREAYRVAGVSVS